MNDLTLYPYQRRILAMILSGKRFVLLRPRRRVWWPRTTADGQRANSIILDEREVSDDPS